MRLCVDLSFHFCLCVTIFCTTNQCITCLCVYCESIALNIVFIFIFIFIRHSASAFITYINVSQLNLCYSSVSQFLCWIGKRQKRQLLDSVCFVHTKPIDIHLHTCCARTLNHEAERIKIYNCTVLSRENWAKLCACVCVCAFFWLWFGMCTRAYFHWNVRRRFQDFNSNVKCTQMSTRTIFSCCHLIEGKKWNKIKIE